MARIEISAAEETLIPQRKHEGDAGFDLKSFESRDIQPGEIVPVCTGIRAAIPFGWVGLIHPRSGLASKGITIANSPGTIDSNYRGKIKVLLLNLSDEVFEIEKYDRIAQIVFQRVELPELVHIEELDETDRGENGFGSSGLRD